MRHRVEVQKLMILPTTPQEQHSCLIVRLAVVVETVVEVTDVVVNDTDVVVEVILRCASGDFEVLLHKLPITKLPR